MKFLKKLWNDPVGASVIASVIVILLTPIGTLIWSLFGEDNFWGTLKKLANMDVKLWVFVLIVFVYFIIRAFAKKYGSFRYDNHSYENDKSIYDTIINELSNDGIIQFLRSNNFAGFPFRLSSLDELDNFYHTYQNDPSFEFINPELEKMRGKLITDIGEFEDLIATNTFPGGRDDLQTVPPEWETNCPEHFWEVVNKIHHAARNICDDYNNIVKNGRRDIKIVE